MVKIKNRPKLSTESSMVSPKFVFNHFIQGVRLPFPFLPINLGPCVLNIGVATFLISSGVHKIRPLWLPVAWTRPYSYRGSREAPEI